MLFKLVKMVPIENKREGDVAKEKLTPDALKFIDILKFVEF